MTCTADAHPIRARARRTVFAALAAAVACRVFANLRALRAVAADLRSPIVFAPLAPAGPRHLAVMRRLATMAGASPPIADGVSVTEATARCEGRRETAVVTYQRTGRDVPSAALLWIHGGGTVIGTAAQANGIGSAWASELDLLVVSVEYRLAPEHPFPAGLEDCYTALCWLHDNAHDLGVDRERIAVGGDSAGGLLAASLCQLARDRNGPPIRFQLLQYPMLDDRTARRTDPGRERSFVWSPGASRFAWSSYLHGSPEEEMEGRSAAPARTADLASLPPAWIGVGDIDLLHDEAVEYARRLRAAGVACELHVEPGMYHGAPTIQKDAPTSRRFTAAMTEALSAGIGAAPGPG